MENNSQSLSVMEFFEQPAVRATGLLVGVNGFLLSAVSLTLGGFTLALIPLLICGTLWSIFMVLELLLLTRG